MHKPVIILILSLVILGIGVITSSEVPAQRLPTIQKSEALIIVDWNQTLTLEQNEQRTQELLERVNHSTTLAKVGLFSSLGFESNNRNPNQALIYLDADSALDLNEDIASVRQRISQRFPDAQVTATPTKDIFQQFFGDSGRNKTLRVHKLFDDSKFIPKDLATITTLLPFQAQPNPNIQLTQKISLDPHQLLINGVERDKLMEHIEVEFGSKYLDNITSGNRNIPIRLKQRTEATFETTISNSYVLNKDSISVPIRQLLTTTNEEQLDVISVDDQGYFIDLIVPANTKIDSATKKQFQQKGLRLTTFNPSAITKNLSRQLIIIGLVSSLLLYLILAAQFQSLSLPLIILVELPIDIAGALILLFLFGSSFNVMSFIGLVVMCGIIINDSILKIHTINKYLADGLPMDEAIKKGSAFRLKPILMTSITTILALLPFLFLKGLGVELQKPLAITVIGGLFIGTFLSLFLTPILYKLVRSPKLLPQ